MGLYIDAGLTTALVLLVLGGLAWAEGQGRRYWPFLVAALPLGSALGYFIEAPLGRWLGRASPLGAVPFLFFLPLALQEGTKLLPLIVPSWRAALADRRGALIAGLALGTGFGIGQMWYLAWGLGREAPLVAAQPFWYSLGEFGAEGLLSSFFQATATALLTASLSRGHPRSGRNVGQRVFRQIRRLSRPDGERANARRHRAGGRLPDVGGCQEHYRPVNKRRRRHGARVERRLSLC